MNNRPKAVAIIPAYNEEGSIAKVVLRAKQYVDKVIVCDDGSTDMTYNIAKALDAMVIRHEKTQGKGEAFRTLSKEVMELNPEVVVTLDGDGQHNPDDIPMLVKPIEARECDVVVGSRYIDGGKMNAPFYRRFGLGVVNYLYRRASGGIVKDTQSGFRAYSQKAFSFLIQCDAKGYGIEGEQLALAARSGLRVAEVPISVRYNGLKMDSKKSPLLHGADLIFTLLRVVAEERPMRYLGLLGMGMAGLGMMLGMYLLWMFNITRYFNVLVALLTMGALTMGMLLVMTGVILHAMKKTNERLQRFNEMNAEK